MAALANQAELEAFLQRSVDAGSAALALDGASAQIRGEVHWSITQETGVVLTLDGHGERSLRLPTRFLTAIASVVEDGITRVAGTDYDWTSDGRLLRADGTVWSSKVRSVVVTFTHGYPAGSEKLHTARSVCLSLASQILGNPTGVRQQSIDDFNQTFAGNATDVGPLLSDAQRASLAAYRLPVLG